MFYAHSLKDDAEPAEWQPLADHLLRTARLTGERGEKFGFGAAAQLAGLLHDLGKYSAEFQNRLRGGERVDHATAGAQEVMRLSPAGKRLVAELVAYAVAGHHTGLPDMGGGNDAALSERLNKTVPMLDPCWRAEVGDLPQIGLPAGFKACRRIVPFQLAFLGRMLFSCLVDADFRDTERFYAEAEGREVDRDWPTLAGAADDLIAAFDRYMAEKRRALEERGAADSALNRLRADILPHVRAQGASPQGVFSLTVPTGGGKTLASLAFALEHARTHRLDRIIYAIPFTSVIDQTAAIFADVLGKEFVLEHHSAIDEEKPGARSGENKLRLAMEDWAAPVVVTTNVQLFESLFANRSSRCRKLHNLAKSVIVLDEAQTIPLHVLRPCVAALDELARNYGTSVVLCTATQPALVAPDPEAGRTEGFAGGFARVRELAPDPPALHEALRRVTLETAGEMADDALVAALAAHPQALVIVNSRKHALALYRAAKAADLGGLIHLTTRMVAVDRRKVIAEIRRRLEDGAACRVVATSLVEAGVDLDFPRVWRAEAGLDSVIQAAGRCNREGHRPAVDSIVTVFRPPDYKPPREIAGFAAAMERVAPRHDALDGLNTIKDYFEEVYWQKGEALDRGEVMRRFQASQQGTNFAFRTVAENFRLIEDGMAPVIVPRDTVSRKAVAALPFAETTGGIARTLQPYLVQVPPKDRERLIRFGRVRFKDPAQQFAVLEDASLYDEEIGLLWEDAEELRPANSVV